MPNLREHHAYDVKKYGKKTAERYKFVHQLLDSAQPLFQRTHRRFFHDEKTVRLIGAFYGHIAAQIAFDHIYADRETTRQKNLKAKKTNIKKK